jgi:hypothetical protein
MPLLCMPLLCMTKGIGVKIGESMGRLMEIDLAGDGAGWGRCLRIQVEIDLSKPLERGRALKLDGIFKYKKLGFALNVEESFTVIKGVLFYNHPG